MLDCNKVKILSPMPNIPFPRKAVLRRMGYPGGTNKLGTQIETIFKDLIKQTKSLVKPTGSFIILKITQNNGKKVTFDNSDFVINSPQVSKMLKPAVYTVVFLVTIGPELEKKVKLWLDEDEITRAYILDAIGSETADAVADEVHYNLIETKAATDGLKVTPRFSPGYGDWDIKVQSKIIQLCQGKSIGVQVNKHSMMTPKKSVSAVFGLNKI